MIGDVAKLLTASKVITESAFLTPQPLISSFNTSAPPRFNFAPSDPPSSFFPFALCPSTAVDCGRPPVPVNADLEDGCSQTYNPSRTCFFRCRPGFDLANGFNRMSCQPDGRWSSVGTCIDRNGCSYNPCNTERSICKDAPAGSGIEHRCICKDGYFGEPGFDGEGCQKLRITSGSEGITFRVGEGQDVGFTFGSWRSGARVLSNALKSMTAPLGSISLTQRNLTRIQQRTLPDHEANMDYARNLQNNVRAQLTEQGGDLADVRGQVIEAKKGLSTLEPSSSQMLSSAQTLSSAVSTSMSISQDHLSQVDNALSGAQSDATAALSRETSQITAMRGVLTQLDGSHILMTKTVSQLQDMVGDSVNTAVSEATENAISREQSLSTEIDAIDEVVENVTVRAPALEVDWLTPANARQYLRCSGLYGFKYEAGKCFEVLPATGFVANMAYSNYNGYLGSNYNQWVATSSSSNSYVYDQTGYDYSKSKYTAQKDGQYLVSATIGVYRGYYRPFYTLVTINDEIDTSNGLMAVKPYPYSGYYDAMHIQGVVNLKAGDNLTLYVRTEYTGGAYRYFSGWSAAMINVPSDACGFLAVAGSKTYSGGSRWSKLGLDWQTTGSNTLHNTGDAFNNKTGYFEAPEDGIYVVSGSTLVYGAGSSVFKLLVSVDDDTTATSLMAHASSMDSYGSLGESIDVSGSVKLKKGQTLTLYYYGGDSSFTLSNTSFSVGLIRNMDDRDHVHAAPSSSLSASYSNYPRYATTCKFCTSSPNFVSGVYTAPRDGSYYIDLTVKDWGAVQVEQGYSRWSRGFQTQVLKIFALFPINSIIFFFVP